MPFITRIVEARNTFRAQGHPFPILENSLVMLVIPLLCLTSIHFSAVRTELDTRLQVFSAEGRDTKVAEFRLRCTRHLHSCKTSPGSVRGMMCSRLKLSTGTARTPITQLLVQQIMKRVFLCRKFLEYRLGAAKGMKGQSGELDRCR